MVKIGVSTKCAPRDYWWVFLKKKGFKTVEFNRIYSRAYFSDVTISETRFGCRGLDLSVHSATSGIFLDRGVLADAEFSLLKAEIVFCDRIGAKELVFHVEKKSFVSADFRKLRSLVSFARKYKVQLLIENLSKSVPKEFVRVFDFVPGLLMNLDLGHLNRCVSKGIIKSVDEFITPFRDRIVYVHVHNNFGVKDDHAGLDKGTLDYRYVLSLLDLRMVRKLILEIKDVGDVLRSRKLLERALAKSL